MVDAPVCWEHTDDKDVESRFFNLRRHFYRDEMEEMSQVDYVKNLSIVAVTGEIGFERIVGLGGYFLEHGLVKRTGDDWAIADGDKDWPDTKTAHRRVCDYIAGMTDNYAISVYEHLFMPSPWSVR